MPRIWLHAAASVNAPGASFFSGAGRTGAAAASPSRARRVQRKIISTATTPSPVARPIQIPTPCQPE